MMLTQIIEQKIFDKIYIAGDPHGLWDNFIDFLKSNNLKNCGFLSVGDFARGIGFASDIEKEEKKLALLNNELELLNSKIWTIRGNHDNPEYYKGNNDFANIKFLPDYTLLNIMDLKILCVGGAISVDRKENIKDIDWFPDEGFKLDMSVVDEIDDFNIMIAHNSPTGIYPFVFSNFVDSKAAHDKDLKMDISIERHLIRQLVDALQKKCPSFKKYYYGHYHSSYKMFMGETTFNLVPKNEFLRIL